MLYAIVSNYSGFFLHVWERVRDMEGAPSMTVERITTLGFRPEPILYSFGEACRVLALHRRVGSTGDFCGCSVVTPADLVCFRSELDR